MFVIKSLSRKTANFRQLIEYVLRYSLREPGGSTQGQERNPEDTTVILRHRITARALKGYVRAFTENESFRLVKRKDSTRLYHFILSYQPSLKGKITTGIMRDWAREFIRLRGDNVLCLGVFHNEKAHPHCHLLVSGVQLNGRSARITKARFQAVKNELARYQQQKYPQIFTVDKELTLSQEQVVERVKASRQTIKADLMASLERIYQESASKDEFLSKISGNNYQPYFRGPRLQGVVVNGKKFRLHRIGYDQPRIDALDDAARLREPFVELANLRAGKAKPRVMANGAVNQQVADCNVNAAEAEQLADLAAIRNGKRQRHPTLIPLEQAGVGSQDQSGEQPTHGFADGNSPSLEL